MKRTTLFCLLLSLTGWGLLTHTMIERHHERQQSKQLAVAVVKMLMAVKR